MLEEVSHQGGVREFTALLYPHFAFSAYWSSLLSPWLLTTMENN